MRPEQLCFFKFPRPLLERFGKDFFRNIPRTPGVYIFTDESGRVLYVGQSRNLRERLSYYKNAQPEREPRRIIRLVHQTTRIELECCETVDQARLRELALIGRHRPRFNVANTLSPTYTFFGLRQSADHGESFVLRISMKPSRKEEEIFIGGFRNRGLCARAFCAIARTVVAEEREITSIFDFPLWLNSRATEWEALKPSWREPVEQLVRGENSALIERATGIAERRTDPFLKQIFETDVLTLTEFFFLAQGMREERQFHDVPVLSNEALQVSAWQMRCQKPVREDGSAIDPAGAGEEN